MVGVALNLVGAGLALAAVVFVPWTRLTPRALLVWPLAVLAVLLVSALSGSEAAALFTGAITLSFLYVGVTQPPGTCLPLLPLAGVTWWLAINLPTSDSIVRLASAVIVWILVAEVPARLLERLYRMGVQLSVRARTDALTGLNNRHDLPRALNALLPGDSLVLLDLDRFKDFNDQYGHQAGDVVLADFGAFLGRTARSSDLAFRYGGEEFLLLLSQTTAAEAQHLVDRAAATWNGQTQLTFSAGIAMAMTAGDEARCARPTQPCTPPRPPAGPPAACTSTTPTDGPPSGPVRLLLNHC